MAKSVILIHCTKILISIEKMFLYMERYPFLRFIEKGNLEGEMIELLAQFRLNHQKIYNPPEGCNSQDINAAWVVMEKEVHG